MHFPYTDYNECDEFSHGCPINATCVNSDGSYSCQCPVGHRLNGNNCTGLKSFFFSVLNCTYEYTNRQLLH